MQAFIHIGPFSLFESFPGLENGHGEHEQLLFSLNAGFCFISQCPSQNNRGASSVLLFCQAKRGFKQWQFVRDNFLFSTQNLEQLSRAAAEAAPHMNLLKVPIENEF